LLSCLELIQGDVAGIYLGIFKVPPMQHVVLEYFRIQMQFQVVSGFVECGVFLVKTPGLVPGDGIEEWG